VDAVLAVGTRYLEGHAWGSDARMKTMSIEIDPMQAEKPEKADLTLIASAKAGLAAIAAALPKQARASRKAELVAVQQAALKKIAVLEPQKTWSDAIRTGLPDDGIVVADITQIGFYGWHGFPAYPPRGIIYPGYQDSLGYAYATSLGVKVAHPDKQVIDIDGDGSFLMNIQELATAHVEKIAAKAIILNNQHLGMVVQWEDNFYKGNRGHTYLGNPEDRAQVYPDYVRVCNSFNVKCERVMYKKDLRAAIQRLLDAKEPYVLDVVVPYSEHVLPFIPAGRTVADMIYK